MQRYALFGHPVAHSLSPTIHQKFAKQTHQIMEYQTIDVLPQDFDATVMEFFQAGGMGANITAPYKQKALHLCDVLSHEARRAQSVNTLMRQPDGAIFGHNTDGAGLMNHLMSIPVTLKDKSILLIGAGGAAKGALSVLLHQPVGHITIINRTLEKAERMKADFLADARMEVKEWDEVRKPFDLIINATSSSLEGGPFKLNKKTVTQDTMAYDLFYSQEVTTFNQWAHKAGASQTFDGLGMLVYQAALGFELWRQVEPDAQAVMESLQHTSLEPEASSI